MEMKKLDKVTGGRRGIADPIHIVDPIYKPRRGQ